MMHPQCSLWIHERLDVEDRRLAVLPLSPATVVASERELSGRTEAAPAGDAGGERLRGDPEPVV
jgi:hypothetical protein